jgi:hypothetical protein
MPPAKESTLTDVEERIKNMTPGAENLEDEEVKGGRTVPGFIGVGEDA